MATKEQIAAHVAEVSAVEFHLWLSPLTHTFFTLVSVLQRITAHACNVINTSTAADAKSQYRQAQRK
eukprot:10956-Heterococcus_DN1.PRE.6